jgi:hypothetical protein
VALSTGGGDVEINRPDGVLARFTTPNSPDRPVALKRRELHELLDEELRRLDADDVYEETLRELLRRERPPAARASGGGNKTAGKPARTSSTSARKGKTSAKTARKGTKTAKKATKGRKTAKKASS